MSNIYVGDNGTIVSFIVKDSNDVVSLVDATVTVTIKKGSNIFKKEATITEHENGKCQIVLNEEDIKTEGRYSIQITVRFSNGNKFSSNTNQIIVSPLL